MCFLANKNTLESVQYGVEGSTTFLECQARSPHVSLKWHLQKENSDRRKEVSSACAGEMLEPVEAAFTTLNKFCV